MVHSLTNKTMKDEKRAFLASDRKLLNRIRGLIDDSSVNLYLDAEEIATELETRYPEYQRKKRKNFVASVQTGLDALASELGNRPKSVDKNRKRRVSNAQVLTIDSGGESSFSENDGNANCKVYPDTNMPNRTLTGYKKSFTSNTSQKPPGATSSRTDTRENSTCAKKRKDIRNVDSQTASIFGKERDLGSILKMTTIPEIPTVTFSDVGGYEQQCLDVCRMVMHLKHPEIYDKLGVRPARGLLLHGPPGCGKTLFAEAIAGELELPLIRTAATELVSGVSGDSEEKIRLLFARAAAAGPCLLFLDEIDAIGARRDTAQREMERRIVSQLISCLDNLAGLGKRGEREKRVLVIGATNRVDSLDAALRRAGRFDREIALGIPDRPSRSLIIRRVCRDMRVDSCVDVEQLARLTPGYVGADLVALAREASMSAVNRVFDGLIQSSLEHDAACSTSVSKDLNKVLSWLKSDADVSGKNLKDLFVTMKDFENALVNVHPSAKREGFATVPNVSWNDIGALKDVRNEMKWSILYPIKRKEEFEAFALEARAQGLLLWGPPGCGKTLLAKAIANETEMNFISVKGPELLSMYVGESERAVRTVFQRARDSAPCVIFFDEIDALCPKRSSSHSSGEARLVNQLLTEMDGIEARKQVFLIGATNRPDIIDPAILRPGRLDKLIFVDFPTPNDRADILKALTKGGTRPQLAVEIEFDELASDSRVEWFTGADLAALVREASVAALKEKVDGKKLATGELAKRHFSEALNKISRSVTETDRIRYEQLKKHFHVVNT